MSYTEYKIAMMRPSRIMRFSLPSDTNMTLMDLLRTSRTRQSRLRETTRRHGTLFGRDRTPCIDTQILVCAFKVDLHNCRHHIYDYWMTICRERLRHPHAHGRELLEKARIVRYALKTRRFRKREQSMKTHCLGHQISCRLRGRFCGPRITNHESRILV